eukprot:3011049-Rhodomonas_salina.3
MQIAEFHTLRQYRKERRQRYQPTPDQYRVLHSTRVGPYHVAVHATLPFSVGAGKTASSPRLSLASHLCQYRTSRSTCVGP